MHIYKCLFLITGRLENEGECVWGGAGIYVILGFSSFSKNPRGKQNLECFYAQVYGYPSVSDQMNFPYTHIIKPNTSLFHARVLDLFDCYF